MFDSLDEQIKHDDEAEASLKERLTRYAIIGAISVGAVVAIFAAVQFAK